MWKKLLYDIEAASDAFGEVDIKIVEEGQEDWMG